MVSKRKHESDPQVVKNRAQEVGQVEMRWFYVQRWYHCGYRHSRRKVKVHIDIGAPSCEEDKDIHAGMLHLECEIEAKRSFESSFGDLLCGIVFWKKSLVRTCSQWGSWTVDEWPLLSVCIEVFSFLVPSTSLILSCWCLFAPELWQPRLD